MRWLSISMLTAFLLLAACSVPPGTLPPLVAPAATTPAPSATPVPTLEPSRAGLRGTVVHRSEGQLTPLPETVVRLARVYWNDDKSDGAFVLEGATSPAAVTGPDGVFNFVNIDPADYVLVVGDIMGRHVIISQPSGKPQIFSAAADSFAEAGQLEANLPP